MEDVAMGAPPEFDMAATYEWHALYDDDDWSDDDVVCADPGDILKVPTSEFGRTVHGILQGLHVNSKGASGSTLVEGRGPALWFSIRFRSAQSSLRYRGTGPAGQDTNSST